jgi:nucleotide-binding universal stress UspA family protein
MSASTTILHPTDFSAHANRAFKLACSLARAAGSRLLVVHIATIADLHMKWRYQEELEAALHRLQPPDPSPEVSWHLVAGEAAPEIVWLAQETRSALIVMGTRGQTGLARLVMGSVAEQVVRRSPCPVVTVKAPLETTGATDHSPAIDDQVRADAPIQIILHPTDFSDHCEAAFQVACSLAKDHAARVIVVHVPEPITVLAGMAAAPLPPPGYRGGLEERLRRFQLLAPEVRVEARVEEGEPVTGIVSAARATESDLIVMGTQGRTGLGRFVLGSVAENVLRLAPCPVVTVNAASLDAESPGTEGDKNGIASATSRAAT